MNGDGFAALVVGARQNSAAGVDAGRAYVYFGGPQLDATPDLTLTGSTYQTLGISVSSTGDVNGDGFSDVLAGAPGDVAAVSGRAYLFLGGSHPDSIPDMTLSGGPALGGFGASVSAGDVTGDGVNDLIVGVPLPGDPIVGMRLPRRSTSTG